MFLMLMTWELVQLLLPKYQFFCHSTYTYFTRNKINMAQLVLPSVRGTHNGLGRLCSDNSSLFSGDNILCVEEVNWIFGLVYTAVTTRLYGKVTDEW
jgi:hypothetical protein